MADAPTYVGRYLRVIDGFNHGDLTAFGELLAEDCTFEGVGTGRAEIVNALQQGRDDGWLSHNPIGTAAAGDFVVSVYENRYADGSRITGAGIMRFDEDGLVVEIVGRVPGGRTPADQAGRATG